MRQSAVSFGPDKAIVGVFTEPDVPRPGAPVLLLFNSGLLPRQGPHRMNVRMAREVAKFGIASLRLDLSGLGDSQSIGSESGTRAQAVIDLQSAMDFLEQSHGYRRFMAFGACSGAVNLYDLVQVDHRLVAVTLFDGHWYRSRWTIPVRHFKQARAKGLHGVLAALLRRLQRPRPPSVPETEAQPIVNEYQVSPPIESYTRTMQQLVDRGVDVQLIYGGSFIDNYSYASQYEHVFGSYAFYRKIKCWYLPEVDHTFVTKTAQQRMLEFVRDWGKAHLDPFTVACRESQG